jgi:hypothetical protein
VVNIITIGATSINVGFKLAEGDFKGAGREFAMGLIMIGAASAAPKLLAAGSTWWRAFSAFSAVERTVIAEAKLVLRIVPALKASFAEGKTAEFLVGKYRVIVEPVHRGSGLTMFRTAEFADEGFLLGREAFISEEELIKTALHEIYRLRVQTGIVQSTGTQHAAQLAQEAVDFSNRAFNALF